MNKTTQTIFFALSSMLLSTNSYAEFVSSDSKNIMHCNGLLKNEIGEVERTKTRNIKSKSKSFSVNYNVTNNGERSTFQCKLQKGKADSITCLKGNLCETTDGS